MNERNTKNWDLSSEVVSLAIEADTVDLLIGAIQRSQELAAAVVMGSDDSER